MAMNADETTVCLLVYQNRMPINLKILVIFYWDMRQRIVYCGLLLQYGLTHIYPPPFLQQGKLTDHTTSLIRYLDDSQSPVICIERDDQ